MKPLLTDQTSPSSLLSMIVYIVYDLGQYFTQLHLNSYNARPDCMLKK